MVRRMIGVILCVGALVCVRADEAVDQFNFATGLLIRDEPALAAGEYRKLLKAHPEFPQADVAWYRLGEALQKTKDADGARTAFERVVKQYPKSERTPRANYLLGQMLATEDPKRAAACFAAAAAGDTGGALAEPALFGQAEALYQAREWVAAGEAYAGLLKRFPESPFAAQALNGQGWCAFKAADYAAAERLFGDFVTRYADHALADECRLKRGDSLYRLKRYDAAVTEYAAVMGKAGSPHRPAALAGRAWCLYDAGRTNEAAVAFREAAAAFGAAAQAAVMRYNAGNAAFAAQAFAEAEADFAACVQTNAVDAAWVRAAAYWRAASLVKLKRYEEACGVLEKLRASEKLPADLAVDAWLLQAEAELARGRFKEAAACYAAVGRDHGAHALAGDAAAGRVLALEKAGDLATAEAAATAFTAAYPKHAQLAAVRFLTGEYRYRLERFPDAVAAFEAFLKEHPGHELAAEAGYKAGWACWRMKKPAQARPFFRAVVASFPKAAVAADAAFMAGRCADAAADAAGAAADFERAAELAPASDAGLRAALERIRIDYQARRYAEALTRAEAFIKSHEKNPAAAERLPFAWLYAGEALLELGRPQEALEAYGRTVGGDAAVTRAAKAGRAWALRKLPKPAEAAPLFEALAAEDAAADYGFWAARSWDEAGDAARAEAGYEKFLKGGAAGPLADEAAYRRAAAVSRTRGAEAAQAAYAELVKTRPDSAFAAAALYDLAWALQELKKHDAATERFDELARRFPKHALAGDARFRSGELAYEADAFDRAAAAYEAALTAGIAFSNTVLYKLGWAYELQAKGTEARAAFRRLATEFPGSALAGEARYREARLLQAENAWETAVEAYAAVPPGPFRERAAFGRAECLRLGKRAEEAVAAYRALLQEVADATVKAQTWLGLGHAYRDAGANQDAIDAYGEVVKLADTIEAAQALLGQGRAWLAMKSYDEAAKAFLKVDILYAYEELKPEAVRMLIQTWEQAGDAEKAAKYRKQLEQMKK
ncbi:MAG: tetratricopeptide repeat protein [Lentisphaerae bacterium]|nr:tetratricopeptide repeat protein [Lentisphaerota bacterium]